MANKGKSASRNQLNRRRFLRGAGGVAAAGMVLASSSPSTVKGANDRLGIGFIGCGGRSGAHFQALHWLMTQAKEPIEIVAACDVYRPRLKQRVDGYGGKAYMDHRELLADPNVDVVCISTPDHLHGYQAIDALKAGKHVYCEKPVTHWRQFELTKELARVARESKGVMQVGTQGMADTAWRQIRKLIEDGLIGKPIHAECGYFRVGDWGERGMPVDDPNAKPGPDLNWEAFLGDSPKRPFDVSRFFRWRMYEDYAGGPSTDLFPHGLTPMLYMLGVNMPSTVVATGGKFRYSEREIPDTFNTLIDYPEGITVAVLGTQGNDYPGTGFRGAPGRVPVIRGWDGTLTLQGEEIVFIPAEGSNKKAQKFAIEHGEDFTGYWKDFLACCRSGNKQTQSPMDLAYRVQTALQMGMLGLRQGKVARFDAQKEQIVL
ncbi:MAG: Gfo/Idh/MocA family oxidoreductase [Phycisphaerae bacterium]|nr:Gfo/Idh/MocA family oxidoreductase [Phycisphaerae bacterium]